MWHNERLDFLAADMVCNRYASQSLLWEASLAFVRFPIDPFLSWAAELGIREGQWLKRAREEAA